MAHVRILENTVDGHESVYFIRFNACECSDRGCVETGRPSQSDAPLVAPEGTSGARPPSPGGAYGLGGAPPT